MRNIFRLAVLFVPLILAFYQTKADSDLEILRQRITSELLQPEVNQTEIEKLMNTVNEDGSWSDINYKDVSSTGFQHAEHLSHLVNMSRAYKKTGSPLKGNKKLKKAIGLALNFWLKNDFICDNWWWNQIGTPNALVGVLLMMDKELTDWQITKALPIIALANLHASGARPSGDRIKIAGILAKRLLFERDSSQFNQVIKVIDGEIKFTSGRGMQYDYSFHHRDDRVNNTLSYGTQYADVFADWAAKVSGTKYQFSEASIHLLVDYYLDGICKMLVYGKYPDPGAKNRAITRKGSLRAFSPATPERLLKATNYRKNGLERIVKIREGKAKPVLSFSRFYWLSEHFTFQRPGFFTSVRMYSNRDYNMEQPYNGEGLKNHYRGDGTNYISRTGKEYDYLSPVYDWQKIPGTTIMQRTEMPPAKEIQKRGLTDFVGAVTDGKYGAVGFDFKSPLDPLKARKSWFFFDKEYVWLGAGITAESDLPVVTTLNQCLLQGKVFVKKGSQVFEAKKGTHKWNDVQWIWHDSIGYVFLKPAEINLSNQAQTGSWYSVNHQKDSPKDKVSKDVFKLWINQGIHPEKTSYQYMIVPAIAEKELSKGSENSSVSVLSNTSEIQAVINTRLNIFEGVFYAPGTLHISDNMRIWMSDPGIIMAKIDGNRIQSLSVSDPTHKLSAIHVAIPYKVQKQGAHFKASWDANAKKSNVVVDLPKGVYAGKSVTIDL